MKDSSRIFSSKKSSRNNAIHTRGHEKSREGQPERPGLLASLGGEFGIYLGEEAARWFRVGCFEWAERLEQKTSDGAGRNFLRRLCSVVLRAVGRFVDAAIPAFLKHRWAN